MSERVFTTEDLALVATLRCTGTALPLAMERADKGCRWVFARCAALDTEVLDYEGGVVRVEPKKFALCLGAVRSEMYRFLQVKPRPVRG